MFYCTITVPSQQYYRSYYTAGYSIICSLVNLWPFSQNATHAAGLNYKMYPTGLNSVFYCRNDRISLQSVFFFFCNLLSIKAVFNDHKAREQVQLWNTLFPFSPCIWEAHLYEILHKNLEIPFIITNVLMIRSDKNPDQYFITAGFKNSTSAWTFPDNCCIFFQSTTAHPLIPLGAPLFCALCLPRWFIGVI